MMTRGVVTGGGGLVTRVAVRGCHHDGGGGYY
jgi:hypothetical protein